MGTPLRWYILFVYACIGTQFMTNWFIFGSITSQTQEYYALPIPSSGSINRQIATILSLGPFVFLIAAPFAVYMLRYPVVGFQYSMRIASSSTFIGMLFICIPSILSSKPLQSLFGYNYHIDGSFSNTLIWLYLGAIINCIASPLFLSSPAKLSVMWFNKNERNTITGFGTTICNLGQCISYVIPPIVVKQAHNVPNLLYTVLCSSFLISCMVFAYFPPHPKKFPTLASKISTMSSSHLLSDRDKENELSLNKDKATASQQTLHANKSNIINEDEDVDISTDSDADDDILNLENIQTSNPNKCHYHSLPFKHTPTNILEKEEEKNTQNDKQNKYSELPLPHTGNNLFPSDMELNKTNFKEYMKFLVMDFKQIFNVKRNKSCLLLLIAGGLNIGVTSGWCSILQDMISPIGMSQKLIGFIGACLAISEIVGSLVSGLIVDRYFHGKLKKCILFFQLLDIIWYFIAFLLLPNFLVDNNTFITIDNYVARFVVLFIVCIAIGLNFGFSAPLYFELMAEISFPVAETSSTNAIMVVAVPVMMGIMQIGSINTSFDTPLAFILVIIAFILDIFVVEKYKRPKDQTDH